MIPDQKNYAITKNMILVTLNMGGERFREINAILSDAYTVKNVNSTEEVMSILDVRLEHVTAVMFDADMIRGTGFGLIDALRYNDKFVMIPVIAASDRCEPSLCSECIAAGASEYFEPPYYKDRMILRITNAARAKDSVTFHEMEMMLKELPSNIYLKDADCRYIFSSHYWHHLKAQEPGWTIRGKTEFDIQKDPGVAKKAYEADKQMIATRKGSSYILDMNTDGIQEYIQVTKSPTYDADGNVKGIIAIMTDVTELEMLKRKLEDRTERISAELKVAAQIQYNMLPMDFGGHKDIAISAFMTPAKNVGGDFYDFFFIDDDHLCMVMADVSGKGVPAALCMTITKIVLHDRALEGGSPAEIMRDTNIRICANNKMERFITVWLGILDLKTGMMTYTNAGHEYPAVKPGKSTGTYELLFTDNCPPVGTVPDIEFFDKTIDFREGGSIFLYTDGVPDAKNSLGRRFGDQKMLDILNENTLRTPEEVIASMKKELDVFEQDCDPFDDITMMCVKYNGKK